MLWQCWGQYWGQCCGQYCANVEANVVGYNLWPMLRPILWTITYGQCCVEANVEAMLWPIFQTACFSSPSIPWLMTWFVYCFPLFAFIPISQHFFYAALILHSGFSKNHVQYEEYSEMFVLEKDKFWPSQFKIPICRHVFSALCWANNQYLLGPKESQT